MASLRKIILIAIVAAAVLAVIFILYLGWQTITSTTAPTKEEVGTSHSTPSSIPIISKLVATDGSEYKDMLKPIGVTPEKTQRALLEKEGGVNHLKVVDLKTNRVKEIGVVNLEDVELIWASKDIIIFTERPSANLPTSAWFYNFKSGNFDFLFKDQNGLMLSASDDGKFILKFTSQPPAANLSLVDQKSKRAIELPFVTLPSKCAFASDGLYCAIPAAIPTNVVLPDDYLKFRFLSNDKIVAYQFNPIEVKTIFDSPTEKIDAIDLVIKDKALYFTNRYNNKVYHLLLE